MSDTLSRNKPLRVAVLMGGMSSERDVSLVSGEACAQALTEQGYDVTRIDTAPNLWEQLHAADPDVVFNALHGDWGEDGRVQGVLDMFGAPYTHSGVMASALAMDKHRAKAVLRDVGITVADGLLVNRVQAATQHAMDPPYVLKPNGQGSSKSVYIVREGDTPPAEMAADAGMGELIICERFAPGRELPYRSWTGRRGRSLKSCQNQLFTTMKPSMPMAAARTSFLLTFLTLYAIYASHGPLKPIRPLDAKA